MNGAKQLRAQIQHRMRDRVTGFNESPESMYCPDTNIQRISATAIPSLLSSYPHQILFEGDHSSACYFRLLCESNTIQCRSSYGYWQDYARLESCGPRLTESLTVASDPNLLQEGFYDRALEKFREYFRRSVRQTSAPVSKKDVQREVNKPRYDDMWGLVQRSLDEQPPAYIIRQAVDIVAKELDASEAMKNTILRESLDEVMADPSVVDIFTFHTQVIWHSLQSAWMAYADLIQQKTSASMVGVTAIAIGLHLIASEVTVGLIDTIGGAIKHAWQWTKKTWKYRKLSLGQITLPSGVPPKVLQFLIPGTPYRLSTKPDGSIIRVMIYNTKNLLESAKIQSLEPFELLDFRQPRWGKPWKELQFLNIVPKVGPIEGQEYLLSVAHIPQIETMDGVLLTTMAKSANNH